MIGTMSPVTEDLYSFATVCEALQVARSALYAQEVTKERPLEPKKKRGPKPVISDEELLRVIREELADPAFHGEGHKARAEFITQSKSVCA
ncbi:MAG: hypothetical protein V1798_11095 [Pseudomonadota bacterium]